jgi:hypothetical protein
LRGIATPSIELGCGLLQLAAVGIEERCGSGCGAPTGREATRPEMCVITSDGSPFVCGIRPASSAWVLDLESGAIRNLPFSQESHCFFRCAKPSGALADEAKGHIDAETETSVDNGLRPRHPSKCVKSALSMLCYVMK